MADIIFLNGPPGSGKNTIADMIDEFIGCEVLSFSHPLRRSIQGEFGFDTLDTLEYEKRSDRRVRDRMIDLSENGIKPTFGREVFGIMAVPYAIDAIRRHGTVIFDGAGFVHEVAAFIDLFGRLTDAYESNRYTIVEVSREGCSFDEDSRGYLSQSELDLSPATFRGICNTGGKDELKGEVRKLLQDLYPHLRLPVVQKKPGSNYPPHVV